jgi:hypothetical protein
VTWATADGSALFPPPIQWEEIPSYRLLIEASDVGGLLARIRHDGRPDVLRLDHAIASGGIGAEIQGDVPFLVTWSGTLLAAESGTYSFAFPAQGEVALELDGRSVLDGKTTEEEAVRGKAELSKGPHQLEIRYKAVESPGAISWLWETPSGSASVVPPSALRPPPGAGVGPAETLEVLGPAGLQPVSRPVVPRW